MDAQHGPGSDVLNGPCLYHPDQRRRSIEQRHDSIAANPTSERLIDEVIVSMANLIASNSFYNRSSAGWATTR